LLRAWHSLTPQRRRLGQAAVGRAREDLDSRRLWQSISITSAKESPTPSTKNGSFGLNHIRGESCRSPNGGRLCAIRWTFSTYPSPAPMGCSIPPCSNIRGAAYRAVPVTAPRVPPPLAASRFTWGLDDKLKTPIFPRLIDFSSLASCPQTLSCRSVVCGAFRTSLAPGGGSGGAGQSQGPASKQNAYFQAAQALAKQYYARPPQFKKRQRPVDRAPTIGKSVPRSGPSSG